MSIISALMCHDVEQKVVSFLEIEDIKNLQLTDPSLLNLCNREYLDRNITHLPTNAINYLIGKNWFGPSTSNHVLGWATEEGHTDVVKYLFTHGSSHRIDSIVLLAASKGHLGIVKYLCTIPNVDPSIINRAFSSALKHDRMEILEFLCTEMPIDIRVIHNAYWKAHYTGDISMTRFFLNHFVIP